MSKQSRTDPLIEAAVKRSRLSRLWFITIIFAVLLLFLILAAILDGVPTHLTRWNFWRLNVNGILTISYILTIYPFMMRSRERAVWTFKPLLSLNEDSFNRLALDITKPSRRWEWLAVFVGIAFTIGIGQPWNLDWTSGHFWQSIYMIIINTALWGLLGWLIFDTFVGIVRISRLSRHDLRLEILDIEMLSPIARWSLVISLVFMGGISLNLIFESWQNLKEWNSITTYMTMVCITVLIFFLSMWSAHRAMADAKQRKLTLARKHLVVISRELEERTKQGQLGEIGDISNSVNSWVSYRRLVQEAPTWPFSAGIIRRLLASMIVPAIVYLIKIFAGLGLRF